MQDCGKGSTTLAHFAIAQSLQLTLPQEKESLAEWFNLDKERRTDEDGRGALHAGVQAGGGKVGGVWAEHRGDRAYMP